MNANENQPQVRTGIKTFSNYATKRRAENSEILRQKIQGANLLYCIHKDLARSDAELMDPALLAAVKFRTETRLKLLNKILPDLKAVEHTGDQLPGVLLNLRDLSDEELEIALRIAAARDVTEPDTGRTIDGTAAGEEPQGD